MTRPAVRGFTLIELLVAISLSALILPMAGGLIYFLIRAQTASGEAVADTVILSRFIQAFRADVHAAQRVSNETSSSGDAAVALEMGPTESISYSAEPSGRIVRSVKRNGRVDRREEFLMTQTATRFEVAADRRSVAALYHPRGIKISGGISAATRSLIIRVEAVVGRDRRFDVPRNVEAFRAGQSSKRFWGLEDSTPATRLGAASKGKPT